MAWGKKDKGKLLEMPTSSLPQAPTALTEEQLCYLAHSWFQVPIPDDNCLLPMLVEAAGMELTDSGVAALSLFREILRLRAELATLRAHQEPPGATISPSDKG